MTSFNPDAWIQGLERPYESIMLYQRPDLITLVRELEAEREALPDDDTVERAAGEMSERLELTARIDDLWSQITASAQELHVVTLDVDEQDKIVDEARAAVKEEQNAAAKRAREVATADLEREQVKDAKSRTDRLARVSAAAANTVLAREIGLRTIAKAALDPETKEPAFTIDQWKRIRDILGAVQVDRVAAAAGRAAQGVTVDAPKSSTPGTTAEDS